MTTRDDLGKRIDSREYFSSNGISLFLLLLFSPATCPLLFLLPAQLAGPILAVAILLWFGVLALLSVRSYWFLGNHRVDIHDFGLVKMSGTQITEKVLYADMDQIKWQRRDRFVDGVYSETQLAFEFGTDAKHDSMYYFLHKDSKKFNAIWSLTGTLSREFGAIGNSCSALGPAMADCDYRTMDERTKQYHLKCDEFHSSHPIQLTSPRSTKQPHPPGPIRDRELLKKVVTEELLDCIRYEFIEYVSEFEEFVEKELVALAIALVNSKDHCFDKTEEACIAQEIVSESMSGGLLKLSEKAKRRPINVQRQKRQALIKKIGWYLTPILLPLKLILITINFFFDALDRLTQKLSEICVSFSSRDCKAER